MGVQNLSAKNVCTLPQGAFLSARWRFFCWLVQELLTLESPMGLQSFMRAGTNIRAGTNSGKVGAVDDFFPLRYACRDEHSECELPISFE